MKPKEADVNKGTYKIISKYAISCGGRGKAELGGNGDGYVVCAMRVRGENGGGF